MAENESEHSGTKDNRDSCWLLVRPSFREDSGLNGDQRITIVQRELMLRTEI